MSSVDGGPAGEKPGEVTVSKLSRFFGSVRASQSWGFIVAIAAIASPVFAVGYALANYQLDAARLETKRYAQQKRALEAQHEFMVLFLRYAIDLHNELNADGGEESRRSREAHEREFVNWVADAFKKPQEAITDVGSERPQMRKGWAVENCVVMFPDGTVWPIPPEIKLEVLAKENGAGIRETDQSKGSVPVKYRP
jgi:hypothetical protein